jgi:hypothetical protein
MHAIFQKLACRILSVDPKQSDIFKFFDVFVLIPALWKYIFPIQPLMNEV